MDVSRPISAVVAMGFTAEDKFSLNGFAWLENIEQNAC